MATRMCAPRVWAHGLEQTTRACLTLSPPRARESSAQAMARLIPIRAAHPYARRTHMPYYYMAMGAPHMDNNQLTRSAILGLKINH